METEKEEREDRENGSRWVIKGCNPDWTLSSGDPMLSLVK